MKRRTTKSPAVVFAFLLVTFALLLALAPQYWSIFVTDPDKYQLRTERSLRHTLYRSGFSLIGTPDLKNLDRRLKAAHLSLGKPVFMRIFKREFKLELWMKRDNRFHHFATYPICNYSGWLGPKLKQGDKQAPEGIYTVSASQLNPKSRWHRAFNLGFPNRFDRAHGRTGTYLMVHGGCSSVGCYAMTNDTIDEIWKIVTAAFNGGQQRFQIQVFPFQMTDHALKARTKHKWAPFWQQLKPAYDAFEQTQIPPNVTVCNRRYTVQPGKAASNGSTPVINRCKTARNSAPG